MTTNTTPSSETKNIRKLFVQINQAVAQVKSDIQMLDDQIEEKQRQRDLIMDGPVSMDDYLYFIRKKIDHAHKSFGRRIGLALGKKPRDLTSLIRLSESDNIARISVLTPAHENWMYYYFGDLMLEGVKKRSSIRTGRLKRCLGKNAWNWLINLTGILRSWTANVMH
jgi:hypothetical protein